MSFGVPAAFFWLALAVPVIGLYILRVRLRRIPVSTSLFWDEICKAKPPRSLWHRLRHLLSLLLQLLFLLLLTLAMADPHLSSQVTQPRRIVLVIDRSASMQADDVAPTRFAAAIRDAQTYVDGMRLSDELAVVLAGGSPEVLIGMNRHVPTIRRLLSGLVAEDGPTELEPALELARQLIGDHPRGEVIVYTDGCFGTADAESAPDRQDDAEALSGSAGGNGSEPRIQYQLYSGGASNVGITQFQARRSLTDPLGYEVFVQVKNAAAAAVEVRLYLELDGSTVDILPLSLEPDELWSRSIEKTSRPGGVLSARLTDFKAADAAAAGSPNPPAGSLNSLSVDDSAWAVLANRGVQQVLIVSPGNLFLEKVFESSPLVSVRVVHQLPETWPSDTLIVLHQLVPETVPAGDVFVVDPAADSDLWAVGELLTGPVVTVQDTESPLMAHVELDNVWMPRARSVAAVGAGHQLVSTVSGDPLYLELFRESGRCLLLNINLEDSDLAFRTVFPIMISNALSWFAGTSGELTETMSTGDMKTMTVNLPVSAEDSASRIHQLQLIGPDGGRYDLPLSAADGSPRGWRTVQTTIGPLNRTGLYSIQSHPAGDFESVGDVVAEDSDVKTTVAVNLSNQRESDLRPSPGLSAASHDRTQSARWWSRPVWFCLACVAGLLTVVEWCLYNRRITD